MNSVDSKNITAISEDQKALSYAEWLSGFSRKTVITPIITLVIYCGTEKYDGPLSLHEMMDNKTAERFRAYIEDYRLHLVSVRDLDDEYLRSFKTKIGIAMEFAKYADDKKDC